MQRLPGGSCQVNDGPLMFTSPTGQIHRGNHRRNDVIELGESGDDGVAKWGSYQGNTMSTAFPNGAARATTDWERRGEQAEYGDDLGAAPRTRAMIPLDDTMIPRRKPQHHVTARPGTAHSQCKSNPDETDRSFDKYLSYPNLISSCHLLKNMISLLCAKCEEIAMY